MKTKRGEEKKKKKKKSPEDTEKEIELGKFESQ